MDEYSQLFIFWQISLVVMAKPMLVVDPLSSFVIKLDVYAD